MTSVSKTGEELDGIPGNEVPEFERLAYKLGPEAKLVSIETILYDSVVHSAERVHIERKFVQHLYKEMKEMEVLRPPSDCLVCQGTVSIDDADLSPPKPAREVEYEHPKSATHGTRTCTRCKGSGWVTCSTCNGRGYTTSTHKKKIEIEGGELEGQIKETEKEECSCKGGKTVCRSCDENNNQHEYTRSTVRYYTKSPLVHISDPDFPNHKNAIGVDTSANEMRVDADVWQTIRVEELEEPTDKIELKGLRTEVVLQKLSAVKVEYSLFDSRRTAYLLGNGVVCSEQDFPHRPLTKTKEMISKSRTNSNGGGKTGLGVIGGAVILGVLLLTTSLGLNHVIILGLLILVLYYLLRFVM